MSHFADRNVRRRTRLRYLLPLLVLAVLTIVLVPAGAAKRAPVTKFEICVQDAASSPSCAGTAGSTFDGNTASTVQLSVVNDASSTVSIASARITVPDQLKVEQATAQPSKYVATDGQDIVFRGINLPAGKSFVATFTADVACGGQFTWSTSQLAYTSSDLSGTPFDTYASTATASTTINTACHLAFVAQPTDSNNAGPITNGGAGQGGPITVGLFDESGVAMTACPVGYASGCSVDLGESPDEGTLTNSDPGALTRPLLQDSGNGNARTATFSGLSINTSNLPKQFKLKAAGDGSFAPSVDSDSFLIATNVEPVPCDNSGRCNLNQKRLDGTNLITSFADLTGSAGFTFMTLSPYTLSNRAQPVGCANQKSLGVGGFAESDGRAPGGDLTIRYYVNQDAIKANYGKNTGQQFIPICAGGRPIDPTTHRAVDCTTLEAVGDNQFGWVAQKLDAQGRFLGQTRNAICDADGYYWGILSSYQDKIASGNPLVTNWGGSQIGGANYRFFDINVPSNWDWRAGT